MIFDLTIIGFGVIGVETLDGIKKILLKKKNKKQINIAIIDKKLSNIPGGVAYSQVNSKFGFFNNPLRLSHQEFIKWFNLKINKTKIFDFADKNPDYNLKLWSLKNKYILDKKYKDYKELYLPRLIYSIYLKEKIISFLKQKKKLNISVYFLKGEVSKISHSKNYIIFPTLKFKNFSINFNKKNILTKKILNKDKDFIKSKKIVIGTGVTPPKKINEYSFARNTNYIWDFYTEGGTNNLLKRILRIKKYKKKIKIVFIGNKAGLLETMLEIERLIKQNKIDINIICISKNSLTLQKAERSKKFEYFSFRYLIKNNIKNIKKANQILDLLVKEFKNAVKKGFNKYDVWTNVLNKKILSIFYNQLSNKEKENYNFNIFPIIRNMTRYTFPDTVSAKNRLERANRIKFIKEKAISVKKYKKYLILKMKNHKSIKCDIIINVSGPVNILNINDEIKFVKSLKTITNKFNERGFNPNSNFMLENGLYLPGTLSSNFNPGRETIIKAITKNSHKVAKNIFINN